MLNSGGFDMHYVVDDITDRWTKPETILLLHGNAESSLAWYGWVPHSRGATASCVRIAEVSEHQRRCRAISTGLSTL